jgi:hypothetical protein
MESSSESLEFADGIARPMNLSMALERAIAARFPNSKVSSFNYFGDFATLLTTCIVVSVVDPVTDEKAHLCLIHNREK